MREEFDPYINDGLVHPHKKDGRNSGNGTLFTAQYIVALFNADELNWDDGEDLKEVYAKCQIKPGLFLRAPDNLTQQDSPDNFVGIGVASYFIGKHIAQAVLRYGRSTFPPFTYNNVNPGKFTASAWLGRQRQIIAHMKWAAGEKPWMWERIWWAIAILLAARGEKEDQDNWTLSWGLIKVGGDRGWIERFAARYWVKKFKAAWPHGIGQVLESYFHNRILLEPDSATHPNAKYLWDEFGEW